MRILITGSREFTDGHIVHDAILSEAGPRITATIVHGNANGADSIADYWAEFFDGFTPEPHDADWNGPCRDTCNPGHRRPNPDGTTRCPAAGVYRNQDMVDLGADVCLAFLVEGARNKGTRDCASRAEQAGIPVLYYTQRKEQ